MMNRLLVTLVTLFATASLVVGQAGTNAALKNPSALKEMAPAKYRVNFDTSAGAFVVEVTREWAPAGADRFYNLVTNGFFNDMRFYRVVPNFMVQWGFHSDPAISNIWFNATIPVDPVKQSNTRGYITYAMRGPATTRTTQFFINYGDNAYLDAMGFAPFGRVVSGMNVVDKIYSGYGEKPDQNRMRTEGNAYLTKEFPRLDYIKSATIAK
jgi:peptidyl-prolyl cis-trans isomerase A (cyclophilin A)